MAAWKRLVRRNPILQNKKPFASVKDLQGLRWLTYWGINLIKIGLGFSNDTGRLHMSSFGPVEGQVTDCRLQ